MLCEIKQLTLSVRKKIVASLACTSTYVPSPFGARAIHTLCSELWSIEEALPGITGKDSDWLIQQLIPGSMTSLVMVYCK